MSGPVLGIDLGTTNSAVAVADGEHVRVLNDAAGHRLLPSVVSFHASGKVLVGYEARERRLVDAENTVYAVKRLIGRPYDSPEVARAKERFAFEIVPSSHGGTVVSVRKGKYALAEISAIVLRELRRVAEGALGMTTARAVVTVPASFNELQRSATKAAGKVAGLDVLRILNEPTAAALAYGIEGSGAQRVAVYDLGGGTFDITILELESDVFEVVATDGDTFLGGEDIDLTIAEGMADAFQSEHGIDLRSDRQAFERLRAAGEWAKCQLSTDEVVELTVEELAKDRRGRSLDLRFTLTVAELEALSDPLLERSFQVCSRALATASMKANELDAIVLVGGPTRMPRLRQLVRAFFGREPRVDRDPDLVVCQGAAIHGFALGGAPQQFAPPPPPQPKRPLAVVPRPKQPAFAPPELPAPSDPPGAPLDQTMAMGPAEPAPLERAPARETMDYEAHAAAMALADAAPGRGTIAYEEQAALDAAEPETLEYEELAATRGTVEWGVESIEAFEESLKHGKSPVEELEVMPLSRLRPARTKDAHTIEIDDDLDALSPSKRSLRSTIDSDLDVLSPDLPALGRLSRSTLDGDLDILDPEPQRLTFPPDRSTRDDLDLLAPDESSDELGLLESGSTPTRGTWEADLDTLMPDDGLLGPDSGTKPTRGTWEQDLERLSPDDDLGALPTPFDDLAAPFAIEEAAAPVATQPFAPLRPPASAPLDAPFGIDDRPQPKRPPPVPLDALPSKKERRDATLQFGTQQAKAIPAPSLADVIALPAPISIAPQPILRMPAQTPLLMDVTPLALGIETVGGFCRTLIVRNAPVPAEHRRIFTTGHDDQAEVAVRVCQGDSDSFERNQILGELILADLPARSRGKIQIEVSFQLDPGGTLSVRARDVETGQSQATRIDLRGGLDDDEIASMRARQQRELG